MNNFKYYSGIIPNLTNKTTIFLSILYFVIQILLIRSINAKIKRIENK